MTLAPRRREGPLVGDCLAGQRTKVGLFVLWSAFLTHDLPDGSSDQSCRLDTFPLEPASKGIHATLLPVETKHYIVDRLHQKTKPLLTGPESIFRLSVIRRLSGVGHQSVAGGSHP